VSVDLVLLAACWGLIDGTLLAAGRVECRRDADGWMLLDIRCISCCFDVFSERGA
jgi:hypothetical protein